MKKRLLSGLLVFAMLLTLLPVSAFAEESDSAAPGGSTPESAVLTVTAFDALDAATAAQVIPLLIEDGTAQEPSLPDTLTATVEGAEQPATIENVEWSAEPAYNQTTAGS